MREKAGKLFGVLMVLAVLLGACEGAVARPGQLDPGFGRGGIVTTPVDLSPEWRRATVQVSVAADSSFVVASRNRLVRYLPDGRLDESFADAGQLRIDEIEDLEFGIDDVATDSHGRIVVFGASGEGISESFPASRAATILRLDSDGHLDSSFGGGDGVVRGDLGLKVPGYDEIGTGVSLGLVDAEDRPVLVENVNWVFFCGAKPTAKLLNSAVVRLTSAGEVDPSFTVGEEGLQLGVNREVALTLRDGESPQLLFPRNSCEPRGLTLKRFTPDGDIDTTFGSRGLRTYAGGISRGMTVDPLGKTLLVGELRQPYRPRPRSTRLAMVRLAPDGKPDPGFGRGGTSVVSLPRHSAVSAIVANEAGQTLLTGTLTRPLHRSNGKRRHWIWAAQLDSSGRLDRSFGHEGYVRTSLGWASDLMARDAFLDGEGRLTVAGATGKTGDLPGGGFALVRYLTTP